MKILTWDTPNFGDRLNDLVWPHYLPSCLDDGSNELLVGIGSLLNHRLPVGPVKWVLGSGVGHGDPPRVDGTWKVLWVRGPHSVNSLGLPGCRYITDGALLLADLMTPAPGSRFTCSFIPHCSAIERGALQPLQEICETAGLHFINPHWPARVVLDDIRRSEKVVTEALHGAIVADAFRIPWVPAFRQDVLAFKWMDWTESMGLSYQPQHLPYRPQWFAAAPDRRPSRRLAYPLVRPWSARLLERRLRALAAAGPWQLSDDQAVTDKVDEMKECLARLESRLRPLSTYSV